MTCYHCQVDVDMYMADCVCGVCGLWTLAYFFICDNNCMWMILIDRWHSAVQCLAWLPFLKLIFYFNFLKINYKLCLINETRTEV